METETGFVSHPLHNVYFFESPIPKEELNDKNIFLRFTHEGRIREGIFKMSAWSPPTLPKFTALTARAHGFSGPSITYHALKFDSARASKIRRTSNQDYNFEADLGQLQPMCQVSAVFDAVCKEFERGLERFMLRDEPA